MTAAATRTAELFAMDMASAKPSPGHMTAEVML
jgi:hypothetical protein